MSKVNDNNYLFNYLYSLCLNKHVHWNYAYSIDNNLAVS